MPVPIPAAGHYYERTELGLPLVVHNLDGITKRPPMALRRRLILCHYTGVPIKTRRYADVDTERELVDVVAAINRWKRNEYNYVIAQTGDVVEFAGRFRGAHCGPWSGTTWNDVAYGVLFLNAVEEPITWPQIAAFGWLKNVLRWTQQVLQTVDVQGHQYAKPTGCPGASIMGALPGLRDL